LKKRAILAHGGRWLAALLRLLFCRPPQPAYKPGPRTGHAGALRRSKQYNEREDLMIHRTSLTRRVLLGLTAAAAGLLMAAPASAEASFEGKTIEWIIPFSAGGGSDVWARFNAPFLSKYLPGNPTVVVVNEPGGGSTKGTNLFAARAKPDGLTILGTSGSTQFPYLLGDPRVRYEYKDWDVVMAAPTGGVVYTTPSLGLSSPADIGKLKGQSLVYASQGATSLDLVPLLAFKLMDLDVKHVFGFKGRGDGRLAFERGETNIDYQTTPAYNATVVPLIKEGKAIPLMSFGQLDEKGNIIRDPAVPDLPTVPEVYEKLKGKKPSGKFWETYKIFMPSAFAVQKILWVKGGAPEEVARVYYAAADRLEKDKEFQTKTDKILGGYPLLRGDRLEKTIQQAFQIDADTQRFVKEWVGKKYRVKFD
jgi:tripartite-type tricarboxylate transporter receptor subunit TctC